ncbi:magnesium chelatase subunit D [Erythrobacter sp. CCH5-A1]|jgi:magnesium chelatase subunit D|uniref:magnesium chelatase subunit D n=1 Tax=Erythrobacter sp. CCH5-A1 TaxID=1768792 RepID=UPI000834AD93|nr:magnesium chelatase subunit D [Erythrobacter sp. CCH5-A1]
MTPPPAAAADPLDDAVLAARLFLFAPAIFKGLTLRGSSPAREALVLALTEAMPLRRLPGHVDDERLLGGIDLAASLSAGRPVRQTGLIEEAQGGALIAGMAERMDASIAGRLAQALDEGGTALVLLDDAAEPEEAPPASLTERLAFLCDLSSSRRWQGVELAPPAGRLADVAPLAEDDLHALAATAESLGVESLRALIHAAEAARSLAALSGRTEAGKADLAGAVRLVLAPRATRLPPQDAEAPPPEEPPPPDNQQDDQSDSDRQQPEPDLSEILVEAARASIPAGLLEQLAQGKAPRRTQSSGTGQKRKAATRGKPLGARPGMPRGGHKLALIDSLRAAVPWQAVRRRELGGENGADSDAPIIMRKEDLRVRRFEERAARVTIFAVDASGSAAAARLAEAKGAVELMLAQAYVTRSEVALVAFRGTSAELLLPPTRSLTRARRTLAELPGGGGTPLAMGLNAAREVAESVVAKGRSAALVILTDGRANIAADGSPGRPQAAKDAEAAARAIAARQIDSLVVDISARPGPEGAALAAALGGRFLALPRADARMLKQAIDAVQPLGKAA